MNDQQIENRLKQIEKDQQTLQLAYQSYINSLQQVDEELVKIQLRHSDKLKIINKEIEEIEEIGKQKYLAALAIQNNIEKLNEGVESGQIKSRQGLQATAENIKLELAKFEQINISGLEDRKDKLLKRQIKLREELHENWVKRQIICDRFEQILAPHIDKETDLDSESDINNIICDEDDNKNNNNNNNDNQNNNNNNQNNNNNDQQQQNTNNNNNNNNSNNLNSNLNSNQNNNSNNNNNNNNNQNNRNNNNNNNNNQRQEQAEEEEEEEEQEEQEEDQKQETIESEDTNNNNNNNPRKKPKRKIKKKKKNSGFQSPIADKRKFRKSTSQFRARRISKASFSYIEDKTLTEKNKNKIIKSIKQQFKLLKGADCGDNKIINFSWKKEGLPQTFDNIQYYQKIGEYIINTCLQETELQQRIIQRLNSIPNDSHFLSEPYETRNYIIQSIEISELEQVKKEEEEEDTKTDNIFDIGELDLKTRAAELNIKLFNNKAILLLIHLGDPSTARNYIKHITQYKRVIIPASLEISRKDFTNLRIEKRRNHHLTITLNTTANSP